MSELGIYDVLPFFNKEGEIFMELIGDPRRPELPVISNINDINQGALSNALLWHKRFQAQATAAALDVTQARGILLDRYQKVYGVIRLNGQTDEDYANYILESLTSVGCAAPQIDEIVTGPGITKFKCSQMGMFSDYSATDVRIMDPGSSMRLRSGIPTYLAGATYLYVDSFSDVTVTMIALLRKSLAAGTAVLMGVHY